MGDEHYRAMARRARRLAATIGDEQTRTAMLQAATEYDAKADALDSSEQQQQQSPPDKKDTPP